MGVVLEVFVNTAVVQGGNPVFVCVSCEGASALRASAISVCMHCLLRAHCCVYSPLLRRLWMLMAQGISVNVLCIGLRRLIGGVTLTWTRWLQPVSPIAKADRIDRIDA